MKVISTLFTGLLICHQFSNCHDIKTLLCMKNQEMCVVSKLQMSLECTDEDVLDQPEINSDLLHYVI